MKEKPTEETKTKKPLQEMKEISEELKGFLPLFMENRQKDLHTLQKALAKEDFQKIWQMGHVLRGICTPYGFPKMATLGEGLQDLANKKDFLNLKKKLCRMEEMIKDFPSPTLHQKPPLPTLPPHLKKYTIEQDYSRYTPVDQAVWRYILYQLKDFLSKEGHASYIQGLLAAGMDFERIPRISKMSEKLQQFGWQAVPVDGFLPPAVFMELQSMSFLPIASAMRNLNHILYTPAPDIVHEAAGHAPMLMNKDFADYLRNYAQVAKKAIMSSEDLKQYAAIRELSDKKENPTSTPEEIANCAQRLEKINQSISHVSEAAQIGRMNWWTAEYGLIGGVKAPKIFGAGLLSSVGEARNCLSPKVKKIPLSSRCLEYAYDITTQQPQLFVTPNFAHLSGVLEEVAQKMAFRKGGLEGLQKILQAQSVNTVQFNSGLQISGQLREIIPPLSASPVSSASPKGPNSAIPEATAATATATVAVAATAVAYLQFTGPCQLSYENEELERPWNSNPPRRLWNTSGTAKVFS